MNPEKGNPEIYQNLQLVIEKEIGALREILANLHQEKINLQENNPEIIDQILFQRRELVEELNYLQTSRKSQTESLAKLQAREPSQEWALEQLLSYDDEESQQILILSEKLLALTEKMKTSLTETSFGLSERKTAQKKKTILAVFPKKD